MIKIFDLQKNGVRVRESGKINNKTITWIRAIDPNQEELLQLSKITKIPLNELKESVEEEESARLTVGKYIELIYDVPLATKKRGVVTEEVYFYLVNKMIVTIEFHPSRVFSSFESKLSNNKARFLLKSQGTFLYHALDEINNDFLTSIDRVTKQTNKLKLQSNNETNLDKLYEASITFAYFNNSLLGNLEVLNQLRKTYHKFLRQEDRDSFQEIYIDMLQIIDTEKIQREVVMNMINLQSIRSSEELNQTMKRLTALALIALFPTFITGLFGMNVKLPLASNEHAFIIINGFIIVISIILFLLFKKFDWV